METDAALLWKLNPTGLEEMILTAVRKYQNFLVTIKVQLHYKPITSHSPSQGLVVPLLTTQLMVTTF